MGWVRALAALLIGALGIVYVAAQPAAEPLLEPEPPEAAPAIAVPLTQPEMSDEALAAFVDGYVADAIHRSGIPGGTVVLVRDGRTILAKGYGYADFESRRPAAIEDSLFRQASISKTFIWLLALQLVEEGRLDLDGDINAHLDFEVTGMGGAPITMRHLMTHSAGFAERYWGVYQPDVETPLGEQLRRNVPARVYPPGSTMAYSNYGSSLAAYVVERLRGQPFDRLVAERIFAPAGMTRSSFAQPLPEPLRPLLVSGYAPGSREPFRFENLALPPAGALTASSGDMGRYLAMLMAGGEGPNGRIVSAGTIEAALRLDTPLGPGLRSGFGLGFMVGEHRGVRTAGHGGNLATTATDLQMLPDHGIGWHLAFNGQGQGGAASALRANLAPAIIARFLVPDAPRVAAAGPSSAGDLAGSYLNTRRARSGPVLVGDAMALLKVRALENGALQVDSAQHSDGNPRRWLPAGRDRFVEEETGAALVATRDEAGNVVRIASPLLYPVAVFEPAPAAPRIAQYLFIPAFAILLFAAIAGPAGWAIRRSWRAAHPGPSSRLAVWTRPAARAGVWLIVGTIAAFLIQFGRIQADTDTLFLERGTMTVLGLLGWLCALAAAAVAIDAVAAWRDPSRGWPRRIGMVLVALAAVAVVWHLFAFGLAGFTTDY